MGLPSSSFSVAAINIVAALCAGIKGYPRELRELGYVLRFIERSFPLHTEDEICPDLVIGSAQQSHTLICECKSGSAFKEDQARRYDAITPDDLRRLAALPANEVDTHDCAYLVPPASAASIDALIIHAGYAFPVVSVDDTELKLAHRRLAASALSDVLIAGLDLSRCILPPRGFFPFDDAAPDWTVAMYCLNGIMGVMHSGEAEFSVDDVAAKVLGAWPQIGVRYRSRLRDKIRTVVNRLADGDMSGYFVRKEKARAGEPATWAILQSPARETYDRRTAKWKALGRACGRAVERLRGGQPPLPFTDQDEHQHH